MKNANVWKRGCACVLSLAMMACMLSGLAVAPVATGSSNAPEPQKFVADFSELGAILREDGKEDEFNSGTDAYKTAYTVLEDVSTTDGKLNSWMGERFLSRTNREYSSVRSWFGQHSNLISEKEDAAAWNSYAQFSVSDSVLRYQLGGGSTLGQMLRRVDTLSPKYNGTEVRLNNFEAKLTFTLGTPSFRGGLLFNFHEGSAGNMWQGGGAYAPYRYFTTGQTLVIGNGTGTDTAVGTDGWVFYDKAASGQTEISATSVDGQHQQATPMVWYEYKVAELHTSYERFDRTLHDQKYTLTVKVVGESATFTLQSADGTFTKTMTKTIGASNGYMSIGVSNRDTKFYDFQITELDAQGNAVDYGTYHNDGVETFYADFTDLPDAHYNGTYKYDETYTAYSKPNEVAVMADAGASYKLDVKAAALADYLESKFDFYVAAPAGGSIIERWNAAGYFVDQNGNNLSAYWKADGVQGYDPATGIAAGDYMPGCGQGGFWSIYPYMSVSENRWLRLMPDIDGTGTDPFAVTSFFTLQNADDSDVVLKNFKLDLDFRLSIAGDTWTQNQSPLFVKFGGYEAPNQGTTDGAMFALSYNGGYFLDDLSASVNGSTFTSTKAANGAPFYTKQADEAIGGGNMHLTLTVKNGAVNAKVTNEVGKVVLDVTKSDIDIQSGLIQIGTTYAGIYHGMPYFGAVEVTRLDASGNAIDFSAQDDSEFDASFVGLTDYREGNYYSNNGKKDAAILNGKANEKWLTKATDANFYQFGADDTKLVDYLSEKFSFYHIAHDGNVYEMANPYQNTQDVFHDQFTGGGYYWGLCNGRWLRAQPQTVNTWGELFRKQVLLVPNLDGEQLVVSDFTASFNLEHHSASNDPAAGFYGGDATTFTFHSGEVARVTGSGSAYGDAVTLVFTRNELVIYDGRKVDFSWQDLLADEGRVAWSNGNADKAHVEIAVKKNKMDLKVTSMDGKTVYYEVTDKELSHRDGPGYLYFGIANSAAALADITITPIYREDMAAPTGLEGGMKSISGFVKGSRYEYRLVGANEWTDVPVGISTLTGLTGGVYEVRLAASKYCAVSSVATVVVRDGNIAPGDGTVERFEADFAKLAELASDKFDATGYYVPQENDTAIQNFITERFGMFYNNNLRHAAERFWLGQSSNDFEEDAMCPSGSYWIIGDDGVLQRKDEFHFDGEMMRKAEILTLKAPNGNYASLKNFEAEYTVTEDHNEGAVVLSFRNANYDHVLCTDGYFANQTQLVFADQETIIIGVDQDGKHGITIGSGDDVHGRKENGPNGEIVNSLRYVDIEIPALADHAEYTVSVKALGDQLTIVIRAKNGNVIWENTDHPHVLERKQAGYMALAVTNAYKGVKGLVVTQLDDEGNPVDFGTGTRKPASHYDETNTTYYDFSDESQMKDFDTYFLPEWSNLRKPLIKTTGTSNSNWYVKNGALNYKQSELYRDPTTLAGGVEIEGTRWKHAIDWMVPYTGNLGIAVLKTKRFENFILEMDFTGQDLWTQVGFGADNTTNGVYHSTQNGGCNLALAWNGGNNTASAHLFYPEGDGYKQKDFPEQFAYKDRGTHHLQMIVSDLKLYVSLDGSEPIVYDLPETYDGGYIYFTLNNPVAVLDNIRIVNLDRKAIVLTDCAAQADDQVIDRSKGEMLVLPSSVSYGTDRNGYEYPVFVTWESDEYRSYKEGSFDFKVGAKRIHNLRLSSSYNGSMTVVNQINGDFDSSNTRKYYFDHPNDFLDFDAHYSETRHDREFWRGTAEYQNGTTEYSSAYEGELVKAENVTDKWQLNGDGTIGNTYYVVKGGSSPTERLKDVSTLVLTDYNLLNFRVEMDVKKGDTWWYNYALVGVQDPAAMYYALSKSYHSTADGGNTGFKTTDLTKKGGVWAFVEQEGYINVTGNLDGGLSERFTTEPEGYEFIKTFDKNAWHHMVVEVVDGIMMIQVDDSMSYYLVLDNNAIGGYVGIASHGNKGMFKNFQLTALDADGNEVPFAEAQVGFGAADVYPEFIGWNPSRKLWDFDWSKKHFE